MRTRHWILSVALLALLLPASLQAQEVKVAIVDPARIFNEMQETKDLKQKMDADRRQLESKNAEKRENLRNLEQARNTLKPGTAQYQERNTEFMKAGIEYETWSKLNQLNFQRDQKLMMKALYEKIEAAVAEIAQQKGIDLVIAAHRPELPEEIDALDTNQLRTLINTRNILYSNPKADLSNDVLALLDTKYKSGAQ